jgi:hypothetical protein
MGHIWVGVAAMNWDVQNTHATVWSFWGNPKLRGHYLNRLTPAEYQDGYKYGSPAGLNEIMR